MTVDQNIDAIENATTAIRDYYDDLVNEKKELEEQIGDRDDIIKKLEADIEDQEYLISEQEKQIYLLTK